MPWGARGRWLLSASVLLALGAGAALAQVPQDFTWRPDSWRERDLRDGFPERGSAVDRSFTFCRLYYDRVRREPEGQGWRTDYPMGDVNFMTRLSELTTTWTSRWSNGQPGTVVVDAMDPRLFECPFLFASDVGTMGLREHEVARLREYLLKGGFLWVDDFWGERAWDQWVSQIGSILPGMAVEDLEAGHPLYSLVYHVEDVPQIPNIRFWRGTGGQTSERGYESQTPHLRGVFDDAGRLVVLMSHNTDIADGWEREGEDIDFFARFSPEAYALGVNVAVWTMTR